MSQNKEIVREVFSEMFAKGDLSGYSKYVDPHIQVHCPASWKMIHSPELSGITSTEQIDQSYAQAFNMQEVVIDDLIEEKDKIAARWTCSGIHVGPYFGIAATNRHFTLSGVTIYRFNKDKIIEVWQSWDMLGLLEQLKN